MPARPCINLNTLPSPNRKKKYKHHENVHYRGEIKFVGKATDTYECRTCHRILPSIAFTSASIRSDGAYYLQGRCRECHTKIWREQREVRKKAPPKPERCECCHIKPKMFHLDHIHGTTIIRGWLCSACNSAIGKLGDDLEGLLQAAIFVENDRGKITETLHKVFNTMFARTR